MRKFSPLCGVNWLARPLVNDFKYVDGQWRKIFNVLNTHLVKLNRPLWDGKRSLLREDAYTGICVSTMNVQDGKKKKKIAT